VFYKVTIKSFCTAVPGTFSTNEHIFWGEWGGKLFKGKGIKRVGLGLAEDMYQVSIPQKHTFSVEV